MTELKVTPFLRAVHELRQMQSLLEGTCDSSGPIALADRMAILSHLARMIDAIDMIGLRPAYRIAESLQMQLNDPPELSTCDAVLSALSGIEKRFTNYLRYCGVGKP